jgi:GT2 family glycosyltransferase
MIMGAVREASPEGRVTIVVASRNRRDDLARSLPCHEVPVILVDNGSADGTVAAVHTRHPDVDVIALPRNLGAPARNLGVARATTPYVAFADDDSWWAPGALARAVALLDAHPRAALLAARVVVGPDEVDDPMAMAMAAAPLGTAPDLPGPSVLGFLACSAIVRRSAFLDVGGFDHILFFVGEEERVAVDLAARGWGLAYVPDLVVHHHPSAARDRRARAVQSERNHLLNAVLRRPWPVVWRCARQAWRAGPTGRRGLRAAIRRLPWAVARRRLLPPDVEAMRRALEG